VMIPLVGLLFLAVTGIVNARDAVRIGDIT